MATISTRLAFASLVLGTLAFAAACGGDDETDNTDAATSIDAPGGDDGGGDPDAATAPACADYCTTITANCTGANLMYANNGECMATCMQFTPGTVGQTSGNTLGCRLYHANNAAGSMANADTHCRHAGPGGDGACGANCEGFCTIVLGACASQQMPPYANMAACMSACAQFDTSPIYVANATGDNFACRLYHATAAAAAPGTHCSHTAVNSVTCN